MNDEVKKKKKVTGFDGGKKADLGEFVVLKDDEERDEYKMLVKKKGKK
jgi:hypothetical protein